jgi:hypothetical protein
MNTLASVLPLLTVPFLLVAMASLCCWETPPASYIDYFSFELGNHTIPVSALGLDTSDSDSIDSSTLKANFSFSGNYEAGGFDLLFTRTGTDLNVSYAPGSGMAHFSTWRNYTYTLTVAISITSNNTNVSAMRVFGTTNTATFTLYNEGDYFNVTADSPWTNATVAKDTYLKYIVVLGRMEISILGQAPEI